MTMFDLSVLQSIPYSTIFILLVAGGVSSLTSLANRLLSNPEKSKVWRKEIMDWNTELRKAQRESDKKSMDKLMKKQQYIMKLQSKMMWQSMKVTLLFIVPLILMWQVLGGFYVTTTTIDGQTSKPIQIAYLPGIGPEIRFPIYMTSLFWWYLLCSFLFSTTLSHVLGLVEVSE